MKKLDWLIIRGFLGPFILTFFIAIFVLVMQFLWVHIESLASKGLSFLIVMKLLFYASASVVPMALPIAVLLASMMTLGSTAESLELVASKAAGISLNRSIRPLFFVAVLISFCAFGFANNVLPVASFKLKRILTEIGQKMPGIDIQEGSYYDGLKGFTLMVEKKDKDQKTFYGIVVYDHTDKNTKGAENIIKASKGYISVSDDGNYMVLNLFKGVRYSDMNFYSRKQAGFPYSREFFEEQHIIIDISEISKNNRNNNYIGNQYTMMTVGQLNVIEREIKEEMKKSATTFVSGLSRYYAFIPAKVYHANGNQPQDFGNPFPVNQKEIIPVISRDTTVPKRIIDKAFWGDNFLNTYTNKEKQVIIASAGGQLTSLKSSVEQQVMNMKSKKINLTRNRIEFHKKFTMSLACLFFFLIGAPLGAIIRKGGLGLPLIISIVIFIVYYVVSTIFEKSVKNLSLDLMGIWITSFILLPAGIFLTLEASMDASFLSLSTYTNLAKRLFGRKNST